MLSLLPYLKYCNICENHLNIPKRICQINVIEMLPFFYCHNFLMGNAAKHALPMVYFFFSNSSIIMLLKQNENEMPHAFRPHQ